MQINQVEFYENLQITATDHKEGGLDSKFFGYFDRIDTKIGNLSGQA